MGIGNLLGLARESIAAQGFALNVTGQNIANASTPGYVRRDAMLEGVVAGTQTYGGVRASGIHRSVDSFLDARTYEAGSFQSSAQTRDQALSSIENLFNDAAGTGLSNSLTALASSLSALASNPSDTTTRAVLLSNADQFASRIRETSNQLSTQRSDLLTQAKGTVASVNEYASQIAKLNSQISLTENTGGDAADLKDQRDNLVTKLSGSINVHVITDGTGKLVISAGGSTLVEGDRAASLSISTQTNGAIQVNLQRTGGPSLDITSQVTGGSLGGIIEARDVDAVATGQKLDQFAYDVATAVNTQHALGYGLDGLNGRNLFSVGSVAGAAGSLTLDPAMVGHPERLAASSSAATLPGGSDNAIALVGIFDQNVASGGTRTLLEAYSDLVGDVGQRKAASSQNVDLRSAMHAQAKAMRESVSGVSLDEEMVKLTTFQRSYQAASKLMQTADELLAGLIQSL